MKKTVPQKMLRPSKLIIKKPEVTQSKALSMAIAPGEGSMETRKVAFLVADGVRFNRSFSLL